MVLEQDPTFDPLGDPPERRGVVDTFREEGVLEGLGSIVDMLLPRAAPAGQRGLGDILNQFVEFSRVGDVLDFGAAVDPNSDLDPVERAIAALPVVGSGLGLGHVAGKAVRRHQQWQSNKEFVAQQRAMREALDAELGTGIDASLVPPHDRPLDSPIQMPDLAEEAKWTPGDVRESARALEALGFRKAHPEPAAIWYADDWDTLGEAWSAGPLSTDARLARARAIGYSVVEADPGRYAPDADPDVQAFVAAKFALARWETARAEGMVDAPDFAAAGGTATLDLVRKIVDLELATGRVAGPNLVVSGHTRIAKVEWDANDQIHVGLSVAGELLPARVWDWDRMLPLGPDGIGTSSGLSQTMAHRRLAALDYQAQVGQFAANLIRLTERTPVDTAGRSAAAFESSHAQWYPRANATIEFLAERTGASPHAISATLSTMSAQTAWVPDNLVGAIHTVLRTFRPDLQPGSTPYLDVFRGAIEAGDWQYDLFDASSRANRKAWGAPDAVVASAGSNTLFGDSPFDLMFEHYGDPANLMSEQGNLLGLDTDAKKRKVEAILEAGLPPWMVLRMFKTGTFAHTMVDPYTDKRVATIDVHNDRATQGTVWLGEALAHRGTRRLRAGEVYVDPLLGEELSLEKIEAQRPKLEKIGWTKEQIDSFLSTLAEIPADYARDRYMAQVEAHALVGDFLGVDYANQVQAATWPVMQNMRLSAVKKQLKFVKSVDGVRRIVEPLTWDDSNIRLLEGNSSMERSIVGMLYDVSDRHDGFIPRELLAEPIETPGYTADQPIIVDQRADGTRNVWAARDYPGVREATRHLVPTGLVEGGRELHVAKRARSVTSTEAHAKEILDYVDDAGRPAAGVVRTWMPAADYRHPGLEPGERLVVEVPHDAVPEVQRILEVFEAYVPHRVQQVKRVHTHPAVKPIHRDTLSDLRGARLRRLLEDNDWMTIEADQADAPNPAERVRLEKMVRRMGGQFAQVEGWWEGQENVAYFVTGLDADQKVELMKSFDQYAIATPHGIVDSKGNFTAARGFVFGSEARGQLGFTVMPSGEAFSLVLENDSNLGADWAGLDSPLARREQAMSEVVLDIGDQWGGLTWRQAEKLADKLRELGRIRFYTHGTQHVRPGFAWVSESVFQDPTGIWGSVMHDGKIDEYARHRVDVLMPVEDAAGLGLAGFEGERGRRTPRDARAITHIDQDLGEVWFDQDLVIRFDPGAEVNLPKTGSVFNGIRVDGQIAREAVLDLTGEVPAIHVGRDMLGSQPGMIPIELSRGKVKTIRPHDAGDWIEARETLSAIGLFDEGKVEWPEAGTGFEPSSTLRYNELGRVEPLRPTETADVELAQTLKDAGIPANVVLGPHATPELRDQLRRTLVGLFGEGDAKYAAFRREFGELPARVWAGSSGIETSTVLMWDGQKYAPYENLNAAVPNPSRGTHHGITLNERTLALYWSRGKRRSGGRWHVPVPDNVSSFEHTVVHEIGHFLNHLSGLSPKELSRKMQPAEGVATHEITVSEYAAASHAEHVAEVFVRAVFEPHKLTPNQRAAIQEMVDGVRAIYGDRI